MRLPLTALLTVSAAILSAVPAHSAECEQPYTSDALLTDLAAVEAANQASDASTSLASAIKLEQGLGCLEEKLVTMLIGRTYRSIAAGFLVGGNETKARRWFRTAIEVDPAYMYGLEEYGQDHPVRQVYDELKMQSSGTSVAVEGKTFVAGKFYLDGSKLDAPAAVPGRPHLLQQVTDSTRSWVIDGNDFPSEVLTGGQVATAPVKGEDKPAKPPKPPKVKKEKDKKEKTGSTGVARVRPPEKTPLMIAGGALIAGAGGMFVGSIVSRQGFDDIKDDADALRRAQKTTNRLYLGSFAVLAVGGGVLTYGIILDGGAPMPAIRVRF